MSRPSPQFWHQACRAHTSIAASGRSAVFQVPIRTNAKRTRLPSTTPWHHRTESFRFLSLGRPDVSRVCNKLPYLPSSSSHHFSGNCARARMTSRRPYSTTKETEEKTKPGNGSSSVPREENRDHDHDHGHETPHTHSHSIFGHSHSHGEEGHSHGTEQIIAALEGSGTSQSPSSNVSALTRIQRRQRQSNNAYWIGLKRWADDCERSCGLVYALSIAAC